MVDAAAEVFAVVASRIATAASYYGDYDLGQDVIAVAERGELRAISGDAPPGTGVARLIRICAEAPQQLG
jgi:hypothetical protein